MTVVISKRVSRFTQCLSGCLMLLISIESLANQFQEVDLEKSDFLLLDIRLQNKRLLSSIEAFQSGEQTLLPASLLVSALGARAEINIETGKLLITHDGMTSVIELVKNNSSISLLENDADYSWGRDDFEIYLSHLVLEQLLQGKIEVLLSQLIVNLKSGVKLFPIEKQWNRSQVRQKQQKKQLSNRFYVSDVYQLLTPPTADISLRLGAQKDHDNIQGGYSIQTSSDILYHSAAISLFQDIQTGDVNSRINFSRHQPNPNETLWGGLRQYSFGDISATSHSLLSNVPSGLGFELSRRPDNFSRNFGSKDIEGDATPGWEAELYHNGFLLSTQTVPENGHFLFRDIDTDYGSNQFEIRLFGPFGEEEVRRENLNVGANWLPKGELAYDAYVLDRNKTLLDGDGSDTVAGSFGTDMGFSVDYSPFNNTHIGSFFQRSRDTQQSNDNKQLNQHYLGSHIQSAFNNLVIDLSLVKQQNYGHHLLLQGIGSFSSGQNYNITLEEQRDFSSSTMPDDHHNYQMAFATGGILPFSRGIGYRSSVTYRGNDEHINSWLFDSRLSWRLSNLHFSNSTNYQTFDIDGVSNLFAGNLTVSSKWGPFKLRGAANYTIEPDTQLNRVTASASWRLNDRSIHTLRSGYSPAINAQIVDKWDLNYSYNTTFDTFGLSIFGDIDSEKQWSVNLGLSFFIDYDAHNQRFLFSSKNSAASGNLNVTSYLDRNSNNRRDEGDWTLDNVEFSPLPLWRGLTTSKQGRVSLPGVPVYTPFTFTANWQDGVATKDKSYTIYTHPGSRIDIELPFVLKTNISGFAVIGPEDREQPLTSGTIELVNRNTGISQVLAIDIDGFFEVIGLNPGHYTLQVANKDLNRLGLVAQRGKLHFVTPKQGGDYEIAPLVLLRKNTAPTTLPESSTLTLDPSNGDAFYFGEDIAAQQIYAVPWEPRVAIVNKANNRNFSTPANYAQDGPKPLTLAASPRATNNADLKAEASESIIDDLTVAVPPSAIASDTALRAEANGQFQRPITPSSEKPQPEQPPKTQISNTIVQPVVQATPAISLPSVTPNKQLAPIEAAQPLFQLQLGAYAQRNNAENWLTDHPQLANDCTVVKKSLLHLIRCKAFIQRQQAEQYQQKFKSDNPGISSVIKTITGQKTQPNSLPLEASSNDFTIQLLVASQPKTIASFIEHYQLNRDELTVISKQLNDRTLQVLSLGSFKSASAAKNAAANLSTELQQLAWVKKR